MSQPDVSQDTETAAGPVRWFVILGGLIVLGALAYVFWRQSPLQSAPVGPEETAPAAEAGEDALYQDSFDDPASGWPVDQAESGRYGYQEPGFYYLRLTEAQRMMAVSPDQAFTDFSATARMVVNYVNTAAGDFRYGLVFRRMGNDYYAFAISPRTQRWAALKRSTGKLETLDQGQIPGTPGLFQTYQLTVTAQGETFTLKLDGQPLAQFRDAAYPSGAIGFYLETLDEELAHLLVDRLIVNPAPSQIAQLSSPTSDPALLAAEVTPAPTEPPATQTPVTPASATPTVTQPAPTSTATPTLPAPSPTLTPVPPPATVPPSPVPTHTPETLPTPVTTPVITSPTPVQTPTITPTLALTVTVQPTDETLTVSGRADVPVGTLSVVAPADVNDPSYGFTEFEWIWTGDSLPPELGFEVRIWRSGEQMVGAHDAVNDNRSNLIQDLGNNRYRLRMDISNSAGVRGYRGEYFWTVAIVRIEPEYQDLGLTAPPARFRFETPG